MRSFVRGVNCIYPQNDKPDTTLNYDHNYGYGFNFNFIYDTDHEFVEGNGFGQAYGDGFGRYPYGLIQYWS